MAQSFVGADVTQITPGATVTTRVQPAQGGNPGAGVIILVGEADAGPHWSEETKLSENGFGPDQFEEIRAKYVSGPLVDAAFVATAPMNDERLPQSLRKMIIVKTNAAAYASSALTKIGGGTYGTLYDIQGGQLGNLLSRQVTSAQAEAVPTTGLFTYIPQVGTVQLTARLNGGAVLATAAVGANGSPAAFVTAVDALAGIGATGGAARTTVQASVGNLSVSSISGNQAVFTYTGVFTTTPSVGDTLVIPSTSVIAGPGAGVQNAGAWVITAATSTTITATKLSNAGDGVSAIGAAVVAPQADAGGAVTGTVANDFIVYASVQISVDAGAVVDGLGKSLEICELTSGTDLLTRTAYQLGTTTPVTWISKSGTSNVLTSATEYRVTLAIQRQVDSLDQSMTVGGEIGLRIGYTGTTASVTISSTTMTGTRTGGSGGDLPSITLSQFPTIADLCAYINAQTGWTASAGTTSLGQLPATALDRGTFNCATQFGSKNGRIKVDAYRFYRGIISNTPQVELNAPVARAGAGLPDVDTLALFFSGGSKGGTTSAAFSAAVTACAQVRGNFVVSLVSRDATSDITDGLTESSSTYTIDGVHAAIRSHVLAMSKTLARRNRQGFVSYRGTYAAAKEKAGTMASARVVVSFLDQLCLSATTGNVEQFHPWMDSVIAAAGQAGAGYKSLVRRFKNVSGSLQAAGDWTGESVSETDDALLAGLLPTVAHEDGGWIFSSDQTSYSRDSNEVYNSIQAVYVLDQISLETAKSAEDQFVGETFSDTPQPVAEAWFKTKLMSYLDRKLTAPSDDAPSGFRNARVRRQGVALKFTAEIKLNGVNYFAPIGFQVTQVQQSGQ
jgi:hypothetical protein